MEYEIYKTDDELIHWGIRGMKWGQRRYQNKDGSLTPAGKKRYQKEMEALKKEEAILKKRKATRAKIERLEAKRKAIEDEKKALDDDDKATDKKSKVVDDKSAKKAIAKSIKDMTDEELTAAINRARMEDTYRQLRPEQHVEKHPLMKKMLNDVVMPAAVNSGRQFLQNAITKAGENLLKDKVDPNSIEALKKVKEKLQLKNDIEKLKSGKQDDKSLDDQKKEQEIEIARYRFDKEKARDAAKAAEDNSKAEAERKASEKAERLSKQRAAEESRRTNEAHKEFMNRTTDEPNTRKSSSERAKKNVDDNIDWDDWDSADDRKVFTGTVEGAGRSSKSADRGKKWVDDNDIIDAEPYALATTTNVRTGRSYLADHWDDYVWVDDD